MAHRLLSSAVMRHWLLKRYLIASVPFTIALTAAPVYADAIGLHNGSFEEGFKDWTVTIPLALSSQTQTLQPTGFADIVSNFNQVANREGGRDLGIGPVQGSQFAVVSTGQTGFESGGALLMTLTQSIALRTGMFLSGWSFFFNGDFAAQDSGFVKILDQQGHTLSTLFQETSGAPSSPSSIPYTYATPWTQWTWQAPSDGLYTLEIGVSTFGDNRFSSKIGVDNITTVPEPSPLLLSVMAAGLWLICHYRRQKIRYAS